MVGNESILYQKDVERVCPVHSKMAADITKLSPAAVKTVPVDILKAVAIATHSMRRTMAFDFRFTYKSFRLLYPVLLVSSVDHLRICINKCMQWGGKSRQLFSYTTDFERFDDDAIADFKFAAINQINYIASVMGFAKKSPKKLTFDDSKITELLFNPPFEGHAADESGADYSEELLALCDW